MPGKYVRSYMNGDILTNAILIPQKCVSHTAKGDSVYVVGTDDVVSAVPREIGVTVGDRYLVTSGLKGGERIISEGLVKARPGSKVSIMPAKEELHEPGAGGGKGSEQKDGQPAAQEHKQG